MRIKEAPEAPGPLKPEGQKFYNDVCVYLINNDLLQTVDSLLIYQAAQWWEIYLTSVHGVRKNGTTVVYKSGHQQVSPDVTNMVKSSSVLNRLLDKLGVGEQARMKLRMGSGGLEEDPMDSI